jgi:carbonic anhydrase
LLLGEKMIKKIVFTLLTGILFYPEGNLWSSQEMTPQKAFEQLIKGNHRYVQDKLEHPNRTIDRREALTSKQEPLAIIVGCSDSRVSPEIVFDQGIGDLFVVRIAGNVIGPIEQASINYGAEYLHASLIFVLGHENCGAVKAVLQKQTGDIEPIAEKIETALKDNKVFFSSNPLENAIKANVRGVIETLRKDKILERLLKEKKIEIVGGYYQLESGKVELCCDRLPSNSI